MARKRRIGPEEARAYWMLVSPAFIIYLLVMAFPIMLSVVLSVSDYNGGKMFGGDPWTITGFSKYSQLFADPLFWNSLKNNLYIVCISVFGQLPLGFIFAYIIYRKTVRWPSFWQGILYVPNIISVIVVGILWSTIFSPRGPLGEAINGMRQAAFHAKLAALFPDPSGFAVTDDLVRKLIDLAGPKGVAIFGEPLVELKEFLQTYPTDQVGAIMSDLTNLFAQKWSPTFLGLPNIAMLPILFVILWMWTGLYMIIFLANMQKIDVQIIESARIDGANEGQVMRFIVLPALTGTLVNSAILSIAGSLSSFALVWAMTGGGPAHVTEILAIYMYNNAFLGRPNFPLANAIALVMVAVSFVLIAVTKALETKFGGKGE
ncbi:MAG: sugar ABC transporter permease [Spirochaetaceae bacterium]|nr:sugar ABC transporter permease [Spirochaetaceae bacterium]